jgi:hypothetical protein
MTIHKIYTGVVKPNRESDYAITVNNARYHFWFNENILHQVYEETGINAVYRFKRVEKSKVRYTYISSGVSYSVTGGYATSEADRVVSMIEKARLDCLAKKELEKHLK